jgi:RimJ/RimL family protein N-acetyltransferase
VFQLRAPIETERLILRAFRDDDLEGLYATRSREDVVQYLYGGVRTREEVAAWLAERVLQTGIERDNDVLALAVERREDGCMIGDLSLALRSAVHRQAEIGFVFHPDAQGQGYARESASAVLDVAFGPVGAHRVYGRTDGRNDRSARLMLRLGMRQEAHFRHNEIFKGDWGEELHFAILEDEWRAQRPGAAGGAATR